jgi:FMN-dependent NADH-azoreductase
MTQTILQIDASARLQGSVSRQLTAAVSRELGTDIVHRDLAQGLPLLSEDWISANFTPADKRTDAQNETLALSDQLISELQDAGTVVIGAPMYNFSIPAALKAWIDLICRAGVTFRYTENGPQGLLTGKRAIVVLATGGTPQGAAYDFTTDYMRHVLGFIGISDVQFITADQLGQNADQVLAKADEQIKALAA